ncbi:4,5-DOPA-extradiol-dioxygenase [Polluticaenibacter yanchengensis]|uniref:4,5-DOPA dioxygenase extradiol n=1 Tax=Polluticaenibacter yanchengensis TaxID=3014562 RepID=A0ABT4UKR0_9BACT|nr:4,5-DOPA dioxygenase extradiol [Chitinophagaceae bacterium LY-5]
MDRKQFLKHLGIGALSMSSLSAFNKFTGELGEQDVLMPALFIGHGSPMNGILDNSFSQAWKKLGKDLPTPKAVLVISAHWLTKGTAVTAMDFPKTIHDFGGFPQELFDVKYPAPGDKILAEETKKLIKSTDVVLDHDWGLDHGAWTVVRHIFPDANIPVLQLSIDYSKPAQYHYDMAKELMALRKKGVLIIGSGNMVHNLRMVDWRNLDKENYGYDWAIEMHELFKTKILDNDHKALINYSALSKSAALAIPTPDHYYPLMYALGLQAKNETPAFFNDSLVAGSLNMTSVLYS